MITPPGSFIQNVQQPVEQPAVGSVDRGDISRIQDPHCPKIAISLGKVFYNNLLIREGRWKSRPGCRTLPPSTSGSHSERQQNDICQCATWHIFKEGHGKKKFLRKH